MDPCLISLTNDNIPSFIMRDISGQGGLIMEPTETQLPATISQGHAEITPSGDSTTLVVPVLIADLGDEAAWRYVEFIHRQYP
jgi:hypothetical protein